MTVKVIEGWHVCGRAGPFSIVKALSAPQHLLVALEK